MCIDCRFPPSSQQGYERGRDTRRIEREKSVFSLPLSVFLLLVGHVSRYYKYPARARLPVSTYPSRRAPPFDPPGSEVSASPMLRSARAQRDPRRSLILIRTLIVRPIRRARSHILHDSYTYYTHLSTYLPTYLPV